MWLLFEQRWALALAPVSEDLEGQLRAEYWLTIAFGLPFVAFAVLAVKLYWQVQLSRISAVTSGEAFVASEVFGWAMPVRDWMASEGIPTLELPRAGVVVVDQLGLGVWKDVNSMLIRIPLANVTAVTAAGASLSFTLKTRVLDREHVLQVRPRRRALIGFLTMKPDEVDHLAKRISDQLTPSA